MNSPEEQIKLLEQKNKSLSNELDKITTQFFEMEAQAKDLHEKLLTRKHSEQLAGWAIDRALETYKLAQSADGTRSIDADMVIKQAQQYCDWIVSSSFSGEAVKMENVH